MLKNAVSGKIGNLYSKILLGGFILLLFGFALLIDRCSESTESFQQSLLFDDESMQQMMSSPLPDMQNFGDPYGFEIISSDSNCDPGNWLLEMGTLSKEETQRHVEDPKECMKLVLKTEGCSKEWFARSGIDGNCRCIKEGTDCSDPKNFRIHDSVKTYRIRYEPFKRKSPKILWVIRTYPRTYKTRMRWLNQTWMSLIEDPILIVGIKAKGFPEHAKLDIPIRENMKVIYPQCSSRGKGEGICCQEAQGLAESLRYEYDWLVLIDDDVFIAPENIKNMLDQTHDYFDARGGFGCGKKGKLYDNEEVLMPGFCGGNGYAFRQSAVKKIVYDKNEFIWEYKNLCEKFLACDVVTGVLARRRGLKIHRATFERSQFNPEPTSYHRVYGDKQFRLNKMINLKTEPWDPSYAMAEDWREYVGSWMSCKTECVATEADEKWD